MKACAWLLRSLVCGWLLASSAPLYAATARGLPNGVAAGDVSARSALLWARADEPGVVLFEYSTDPGLARARRAAAYVRDPLVPAEVAVFGLQPDTEYHYRARTSSGAESRGRFRTPALRPLPRGLRFGVSGDWRGELAPYPAIRNAPARALDFFVKLGDTIYADFPSPALPLEQAQSLRDYRVKHEEVLAERLGLNTWAELRGSTAIYATIDDHEVTNDFAGGAAPSSDPRFDDTGAFINETRLYRNGLRAFHDYMPIRAERYGNTGDPRTAFKPRLYRARRFGRDAALFVLDARSFRDQELSGVQNPLDPVEVGDFLVAAFDPTRTLLGEQQLLDLFDDLLRAQSLGVTWKFVMVPEPIQNLGVIGAPDRFEGYAAERSRILDFIQQNGIQNVVFVAADIHGTVVNNLTYQTAPGQPQIPTSAWEITTGSVAFDAPFGQTVAQLAADAGLLTPEQFLFYQSLPIGPDADSDPTNDRDDFLANLIDGALAPLGYDPVGLAGSPVDAELLQGDYLATHTYGWTEFEIDADTQELLVTTYGVSNYTAQDIAERPDFVTGLVPEVVSQFKVRPDTAACPDC